MSDEKDVKDIIDMILQGKEITSKEILSDRNDGKIVLYDKVQVMSPKHRTKKDPKLKVMRTKHRIKKDRKSN